MGSPPGPGADKGTDGGKTAAEFFEIEGMGRVTPQDVVAINAAKIGLEKTARTLKREKADLEAKLGEQKPPEGPPPPAKGKEGEPDGLETLRREIAADRQDLINEKISLRLEQAGIKIDPRFLNIRANKLSEVDDAVQGFIDENETLVKLFQSARKGGEGTGQPAGQQGSPPPGGTPPPGSPPPAPDKEAEIRAKFDRASETGDAKLWDEANRALAEYRGEKVSDGRAPAI